MFYYYTDSDEARLIRENRRIMEAPETSEYGRGVYLTKMEPTEGKSRIARNIWRDDANNKIAEGKVNVAVCLQKLPTTTINQLQNFSSDGRDLFVHRGPLYLIAPDYIFTVTDVLFYPTLA